MVLLYDDPVFLKHDTGEHPECAARLRGVSARLVAEGLAERCGRPQWEPASLEALARVHHPSYIESLERFADRGGGHVECDTVVGRQSFQVACSAAGAVLDATRRVVAGQDRQALCLVRPPGHHAVETSAMGFCLFNNVAVAASMALCELELDRLLIVDWDVHHGNGTQAKFWEDERVGFLSIHRSPFYPGTGAEDETGAGKGLGTTCNVPVAFGTTRQEYMARFTAALESLADRLRPQLVLVSAGFDTHSLDPVGSLGLEDEDFETLTERVVDISDQYAGGRLVSMLEGGYHPQVLPGSVAVHLAALLTRSAS
jgi:acetoin utilization deacetylase AcuC-like enzyme